MDKNYQSTMDSISISTTVGNIWKELEKDISIDKKFLAFRPNEKYTLRIIGPIMQASRTYIAPTVKLSNHISVKDFTKIVNGDFAALGEVLSKINKKEYGVIETLGNIFNRQKKWQKCIVCNVYVKKIERDGSLVPTDRIKVVAINSWGLKKSFSENKKKIGGIFAHDIDISMKNSSRNNYGNSSQFLYQSRINSPNLDPDSNPFLYSDSVYRVAQRSVQPSYSTYEVAISNKPSKLSLREISYILDGGMVDVKKMLKFINNRTRAKMSGYLYQYSDYDLSKDLVNIVQEEIDCYEEDRHLDSAEENFEKLSPIAFENKGYNDAVGCLEV